MIDKHSTVALARLLLALAYRGYKQVPGYTVAEQESNGDVYIAVQLRPHGADS